MNPMINRQSRTVNRMTKDEAFAKLGQGHELDDECKRIIAEEWGYEKVVRCKHCRYAKDYYNDGSIYCQISDNPMRWHEHDQDWFCADGKRKDSETNGH